MVSDREFLDGIYKKAEIIRNEQNTSLSQDIEKKLGLWKTYRKWTPVLAACLLVIIGIPVYLLMNPIENKNLVFDKENAARTSDGVPTPMTADLQSEAAPIECEIWGEITAIVEGERNTYFLLNVTKIINGFVPETILVKCDNVILEEKSVKPAIGDKGSFLLEEQSVDGFREEYNNRVMSDLNKDSEQKIDKAIKASENGNGFIGYFNIKSIGEYHGI